MNAEGARREWTASVNRTKAPALILVGDNPPVGVDPSVAAEEDRQIQQAIPGSRLVTIPGAGHMVLAEQPQAGTAAITDFIRACT